jgi:hypothetical protein
MKKILPLIIFFSFLLSSFSFAVPVTTPGEPSPAVISMACKKLASMKIRDFQKLAGHRLSFKEKIACFVIRSKAKHYLKKGFSEADLLFIQKAIKKNNPGAAEAGDEKSSQGQTALIFGIAGLALLLLGLFVPFVLLLSLGSAIVAVAIGSSAYKKNKNDAQAHTGKLLGWITLGLIAVLIIAVAIIISSWSWGWE